MTLTARDFMLNTGAALLHAYSTNAQVLALIGQIPDRDIGRGFGHLHEIRDQAGVLQRLVDFHRHIRTPAEAASAVADAATSHRSGRSVVRTSTVKASAQIPSPWSSSRALTRSPV